jgi:hypothetical protein
VLASSVKGDAVCNCSCRTEQLTEEVAQLKIKSEEKEEVVCSCSCRTEQLAKEVAQLKIRNEEKGEVIFSCSCRNERLAEEVAQLKIKSEEKGVVCSCSCHTEEKAEPVCSCSCKMEQLALELEQLQIQSDAEGTAQSACGCSRKVKELEKDVKELKFYNACKEFDMDTYTTETESLGDELAELKSHLGLATVVNAKATEQRLKAFRKEFEAQARVSVETLGKILEAQNWQQADALSKRLTAQNSQQAEELKERLGAQDRLLAEALNKLQDAPYSQQENLQEVVDNACQKVYGKCESMEKDIDALSTRIDDVVILNMVLDNSISRLEASEGGWNSGLDQRLTALDKKVDLSVERVTQLFQETKSGPTGRQERSGGDAEFARMVKRLEGKNADLEKKVEALTNIALKVSAG